ncbi:hypothetical protein RND81_06G089100 [Saponaria officinalis]|uniref:FIGL1 N-terminal domain-containing protein n=1 Tax=Saponaria officinalis TaxID=3572 RepID=A0AAW1K8F8_SAPOF
MASKMEAIETQHHQNWRKEVDENPKRLQSLLFGTDLALDNRDYTSTQVLSLRRFGFLDSRSSTTVDAVVVRPIRRHAVSKLDAARSTLARHSARYYYLVFEIELKMKGDY